MRLSDVQFELLAEIAASRRFITEERRSYWKAAHDLADIGLIVIVSEDRLEGLMKVCLHPRATIHISGQDRLEGQRRMDMLGDIWDRCSFQDQALGEIVNRVRR